MKKQYTVKWIDNGKCDDKYAILVNKASGLAEDCNCGDRVHRGRKTGKACKHMRTYNQPILEARKLVKVGIATEHKPSTIEESLSPFLKAVMNGKSHNGTFSGKSAA